VASDDRNLPGSSKIAQTGHPATAGAFDIRVGLAAKA